jgi:hypothetical protein
VAIKGDHLSDVEALFKKLKYKVVRVGKGAGWRQLSDAIDKPGNGSHRVTKAAYFTHGWTHVVDPECVILTEEKILAEESLALRSKIVVWLSESTSDSYGFWVYEGGLGVRGVLNSNGKVESKGRRLRSEESIVWKDAGEDEILALVHRLGPGYDPDDDGIVFRTYDLEER